MRIRRLHSWDVTPKEAVALQRALAERVDATSPLKSYQYVAGADVSYSRFSNTLYAGVVVVRAADFTVVEQQGGVAETTFPYVPGLLTFRETPVLLQVFAKIKTKPDLVMLDGQGRAHPRRLGYASHTGLCLDVPTLGCAKSLLCGEHGPLETMAGAHTPLIDKGEVIGSAVRTKTNVKPVYVSVGHRIDLESAIQAVLALCNGYRLPEPTRLAHHFVNSLRREG